MSYPLAHALEIVVSQEHVVCEPLKTVWFNPSVFMVYSEVLRDGSINTSKWDVTLGRMKQILPILRQDYETNKQCLQTEAHWRGASIQGGSQIKKPRVQVMNFKRNSSKVSEFHFVSLTSKKYQTKQ